MDVSVGVSVGVVVEVLVCVLVGVSVAVLVGVSVGVSVGVLVGVSVGVSVGVLVGVSVGVLVGVSVGVSVGVFVGVSVGDSASTSMGRSLRRLRPGLELPLRRSGQKTSSVKVALASPDSRRRWRWAERTSLRVIIPTTLRVSRLMTGRRPMSWLTM